MRPATEVPFLAGRGAEEGRGLEATKTLKLSGHTRNGMQMVCKSEYNVSPWRRPSMDTSRLEGDPEG